MLAPGFASLVHAELKTPPCEIATFHGVCGSGMMAIRSAYLQIKAGDKLLAVACASELCSRIMKASRYEAQLTDDASLPFEIEFLRWMLSDGAGAMVIEGERGDATMALRLEWIEIES